MKRRSSEEVLVEFHRLYDAFETMYACKREFGLTWEGGPGPATRDQMLSWMDRHGARASELVAGVRQGLNDTSEGLLDMMQGRQEGARMALACYRTKTGRDYFEDAGHPQKLAKAILRRGRILDETEYQLLVGLLSDVDTPLLGPRDRGTAEALVGAFTVSLPDPGQR